MYPGDNSLGGVPLVKVSDVKEGAIAEKPAFCVSEEVNHEYRRTQLKGDELLITLVGNPGDCVIVNEDMRGWNVARALAVLRLKDPNIRQWLRYTLLSQPAKHLIESRLNTTVQKTLNLKDIRELAVPIAPIEIREAIVNIASSIEEKIRINRQINQTLEQIAQAIFKSWFVDFDPVKAKMWANENGHDPERAAICALAGLPYADDALDHLSPEQQQQLATTAALFPDSLEETELGEIPSGWKPRKLEEIIELAYGKALKKTERTDGEFPVYGSGGITGTHNEYLVSGPGIIVGRKGTVGSLYWEDADFFPIDTVFYVKCKEKCHLAFAFYLLQTQGLEQMNTDAAVPGLNRNNVYRLEIPNFPSELIDVFGNLINPMRTLISTKRKEIVQLETLRDTLLPKLLSGELSVADLPEVADAGASA